MSREYDLYLEQHKNNVRKGFEWLEDNLPELFEIVSADEHAQMRHEICFEHDASKIMDDEYDAYDAYFYGGNRSYAVVTDFRMAWLRHIHRNPHHWQHFVLINDEPKEGEIIMDMPYRYIIEMVCDWWAFSWKSGNLYEIFNWYDKHKDYMKLSLVTEAKVETILGYIRGKLDE